jgi:hypothetical protein
MDALDDLGQNVGGNVAVIAPAALYVDRGRQREEELRLVLCS